MIDNIRIIIEYLRIKRMYKTYIKLHNKYISCGHGKPYEEACYSFYMIYNIDYEQFVSSQREIIFTPFSVAFPILKERLRGHRTLYDVLSDPCEEQYSRLLR